MTLQVPASDTRLTPDVLDFCRRHQFEPHLHRVLRLAEECFQPVVGWSSEVETDPETDDQFVNIDVYTDAAVGVDGILQRNRVYTRQWVDSTPTDVLGLVRVLYHLR